MRVFCALAGIVLMVAGGVFRANRWVSAADVGVNVNDNFYDDATVTINVGDTVTWTWVGNNPHTVTASDNSFDSANLQQNTGTFEHTFSAAGTFQYYCRLHGTAEGEFMAGTVTVQAAPTATNTTAAPTATRTNGPTSTPVTATATAAASATPVTPIVTLPVDPTAEAAAPISAPAPSGGAGAGVGAPQTGEGAGATATRQYDLWGITIGAAGVLLIAGAAALRRRKP